MINHEISDLVSRLKNGYLAKNDVLTIPFSRMRGEVLKILKEHGFISDCREVKNPNGIRNFLVHLKYHDLKPVVKDISVVSKPGKRVYCSADSLPVVRNGLGMAVISTAQGVVSNYTAKNKNIGGEVLLQIF